MGIKGIVTDSQNNMIPGVEISVGNSHSILSTEYGDYFRLLLPGTYTVTACKTGYNCESRTVYVSNYDTQRVDFILTPSTGSSIEQIGIKKSRKFTKIKTVKQRLT